MNTSITQYIKEQYKEVIRRYQKSPLYQQLLKKYNYQRVRGYTSISDVAIANTFLTGGSNSILPSSYFDNSILEDQVWLTALAAAREFLEKDVPVYWLSKNLLKALLDTDLPSSVGELKIPFEQAIFLLPENLILTPDRFPLGWLHFRFLKQGRKNKPFQVYDGLGNIHTIYDLGVSVDKIVWTTAVKGLIYKGIQEIKSGTLTRGEMELIEYREYLDFPSSDPEAEKRFSSMLDDLLVKILLYLQIKPSELNSFSSAKFNNTSVKKPKNAPLPPRWIGFNYAPQKTTPQPSNPKNQPSSHASPRPHFRRGHMKRVPIGQGRSDRAAPLRDRKWVWIEPNEC